METEHSHLRPDPTEKKRESHFGIDEETGNLAIGRFRFPLPKSKPLRILVGVLFLFGGVLGFLPILGFWMVPVGVVILSQDVPFVRRLEQKLTNWWKRRRQKA